MFSFALVNKPGMYLGERREPGDVVDVTGVNVHHLYSTGHLAVLPSEPEQLERLASHIRRLRGEDVPDDESSEEEEEENDEGTSDDGGGEKEEENTTPNPDSEPTPQTEEEKHEAERVKLLDEAEELGITVGPNWKNETIARHIAEKKAGSSQG